MAEKSVSGFNRDAFASQLGNVAQANEFHASITVPAVVAASGVDIQSFNRKINFAISAGNVPADVIAEIPVPFRSTKLRIPGDRDNSGTWTVTCRMDVNSNIRDVLEAWSDSLVGNVEHDTIADFDLDIMQLTGMGEIHQLSRNGKYLKSWRMTEIWPSEVGEISYSWGSDNTIVEFSTTFVFHHKETIQTRNALIQV